MAYITKEEVAEIRRKLKLAYPEIKFSVRMRDHAALYVTVVKSPFNFFKDEKDIERGYCTHVGRNAKDETINHADILNGIYRLCNETNYDNSDIQTDYFDVGFYFYLSVGTFEKPYEVTAKK